MKNLLLITALMATSLPLLAEPVKVDMKAGLWEHKVILDAASAKEVQALQSGQMKEAVEQMKAQLASMPPEQRKQMEAMMEQSGMKMTDEGVSFRNDQVQVSPTGSNVKACITQAQIDRGELPDDTAGCKTTLKQISDTKFKSIHVCSGDQQSTGESEVTFQSPKHYTGKGTMKQVVNGESHTMAFNMEGKWLSNDCGNIKPTE